MIQSISRGLIQNHYLLFNLCVHHLHSFGRSKLMHNGKTTFFSQICPKTWNFSLFCETNFLQPIFIKTIAWQVPYILIWSTFVIFQQKYCTQNRNIYKNSGVFLFSKFEPFWEFLKISKRQIQIQHTQIM